MEHVLNSKIRQNSISGLQGHTPFCGIPVSQRFVAFAKLASATCFALETHIASLQLLERFATVGDILVFKHFNLLK